MKNDHLSLSVFLTTALLLGACKKELNVFPTTSEADGNLITNQLTAQQVLNGVYYQFAGAYSTGTNSYAAAYYGVNEEYASQLSGLMQVSYGGSLDNHTWLPNDYAVGYLWKYYYALVDAANGFISNMTPVTAVAAAAKQQMLAEARFLRAFGNTQLLLYFGQYNDTTSQYGIILRDVPVSASNINQARSAVSAAYTSILTDLDAAIQGLPALNAAIYYANASTAKLLKARVLINRGAGGDYAAVISLTKDIIANGPFALEDSLKDIFLTRGFNSKEVMMGVQPYPGDDAKCIGIIRGADAAGDLLVDLLADDARNQWMYKPAVVPYEAPYNELTKYYSGDPVNVSQTTLCNYTYVFRLSEAWLLEAEATLGSGDLPTAKTLLTTVMSHAGAGPSELAAVANAATPAALQLEIVKENMRNFAYENGVDWFALRRLPFVTIQTLNPNIKDPTKLIFPIPTTELMYNKVIQNPGF